MAETATAKRAPRRTPKLVDTTDAIPPSRKDGFWQVEARRITQEPGKVFVYQDVSPTTASTLRKDHGFNAHSRTEVDENGNKITVLYVQYNPDEVQKIKDDVARRGAKRKASLAENSKGKPAAKTAAKS